MAFKDISLKESEPSHPPWHAEHPHPVSTSTTTSRMASAHGLPTFTPPGSHFHAHSRSYSGAHLSPGKAASHSFAHGNGNLNTLAVGPSPLFTHAESSRETSPVFFPNAANGSPYKPLSPFDHNAHAFQQNAGLSSNHRYSYSSPTMKSRPRGESDLSRPADMKGAVYQPSLSSIPATSTSWFSLPEALTSLLITAPLLLASATLSSTSAIPLHTFPPLPPYTPIAQSSLDILLLPDVEAVSRTQGLVSSGILTSGTLLLVGIVGKFQSSERASDSGKPSSPFFNLRNVASLPALETAALRILSVGLPLYASMLIGASRTAIITLAALAANLTRADQPNELDEWKHALGSNVATFSVLLLSILSDALGLTIRIRPTNLIIGYLALMVSIMAIPSPFPTLITSTPSKARVAVSARSISAIWARSSSAAFKPSISAFIASPSSTDITLAGGLLTATFTVLASIMTSTSPAWSLTSFILIALSVVSMAAAILIAQPPTLRSKAKIGLAMGSLLTAGFSFLFSPPTWFGTICNGGLAALSFFSVLYDTEKDQLTNETNDHVRHTHSHQIQHQHQHQHRSASGTSAFTGFILAFCEPGSLFHTILSDKDSRRIAYFTM